MKGLKAFGHEWASIVRNRKLLVSVIAVMLVPVLYSGMFLEAFWDPYDRLEQLPVAVVNEDAGAEFNGETLRIGDQFADKLRDNAEFDWHFVSKADALEGLKNQSYYLAIEIPEDFSEKTTTLTSDQPTAAKIRFLPNEGYNFLASQIGNTAMEKMKAALNKEITEIYARTVLEEVELLAGGIGQAGEGAGKLADGTAAATEGAQQIEQNLAKLVSGSHSLQDGVMRLDEGGMRLKQGAVQVYEGTADLAGGLAQLYEAQLKLVAGVSELQVGAGNAASGAQGLAGGLEQLAEGSATLAERTKQAEQTMSTLAAGLEQSQSGATQLADRAGQLSAGLEAIAERNPQLAQDPSFQQLVAGSKQLAAGLTSSTAAQQQLSVGANQLGEGLKELQAGLAALDGKLQEASAGSGQLAAGTLKLADGTMQLEEQMELFAGKLAEAKDGGTALLQGTQSLSAGAAELSQGLAQLQMNVGAFADGSSRLQEGAGELASGLLQLDEGSHELSGKLADAATKTSGVNVSDSSYDMFAEPVQLEVQKIDEVPNYGTGFAPYFVSLGLYVGALLLTIIYSVRDPAVRAASGWQLFAGKALTMATVGAVQALAVDAVLLYILDLQVKRVSSFIWLSILISITFMMLIQFLVTTMQNPGRFIAILVLIFQLTSSAGTFPLELIPGWLQRVTPWLPMTYSVAGLKAVISSGDTNALWSNAAVLGLFAVLFAALTWTCLAVQHRTLRQDGAETHTA